MEDRKDGRDESERVSWREMSGEAFHLFESPRERVSDRIRGRIVWGRGMRTTNHLGRSSAV